MKIPKMFLIVGTCSGALIKKQLQDNLFYISSTGLDSSKDSLNSLILDNGYFVTNIIPISEKSWRVTGYWVFVNPKPEYEIISMDTGLKYYEEINIKYPRYL